VDHAVGANGAGGGARHAADRGSVRDRRRRRQRLRPRRGVLGDGQVTAGQPSAWPIPAFFLAGTSTLRLSPRVVASGPGGVANVPVVPSPMPGLTGNSAAPGGTLTAVAATEPGDLVVLVVGLPGAPVAVPGFVDAFALDPAVHVFHTIGTQQGGAPVTGTIAVPNAAGLLGLRLNWQAACYGPVTGLQASNPVAALVR